MANVFQSTPIRRIRRNSFDLSHDVKFSGTMGKLIPTLVQEVLPGDSFKINSENLIRFAPMVSPVMHSIKCFTHYFYIPNRIIWDKWEEFISPDLSKSVPPAFPYLDFQAGFWDLTSKGSLSDYLGLPVAQSPSGFDIRISPLIFAAYQKVYNEYYRDQNLISEIDIDLTAGDNNAKWRPLGTLRTRAWMHDYFTAALPFQQKGPAVGLPVSWSEHFEVYAQSSSATSDITLTGSPVNVAVGQKNNSGQINGKLYADPTTSPTSTTISDLRLAMRLQEWFELAARGGSRYVEQLKTFWNVSSSDKRMNRPEFLGGTRVPVVISEVLQTSSSDGTTPQGTMAGHAISGSYGNTIRYRAEEHGFIIGIMSVMPNTAYQQGIHRMWNRESWEDYAWPQFAHLSEQPILNKEIYLANDGKNDDTFGFIPRYSEYRYTPSRVAGEFRDTLAFWHLGRQFSNRPLLNQEFVECTPSNRIFAVTTGDNLWCHTYHKIRVKRALPQYGVPTL